MGLIVELIVLALSTLTTEPNAFSCGVMLGLELGRAHMVGSVDHFGILIRGEIFEMCCCCFP